jgi:hypothetical protein
MDAINLLRQMAQTRFELKTHHGRPMKENEFGHGVFLFTTG